VVDEAAATGVGDVVGEDELHETNASPPIVSAANLREARIAPPLVRL